MVVFVTTSIEDCQDVSNVMAEGMYAFLDQDQDQDPLFSRDEFLEKGLLWKMDMVEAEVQESPMLLQYLLDDLFVTS